MNYCVYCMNNIRDNDVCDHCGKDSRMYKAESYMLQPGTLLYNRYLVGAKIGGGGFGITYIALDQVLDIRVAIKEYYPVGYVNRDNTVSAKVISATSEDRKNIFENGRDKFIIEARILAKFTDERGIVDVKDCFEENNTAYIVMEYLKGETLKSLLKRVNTLSYEKTIRLLMPAIKSLKRVHEANLLHRDLSPDNIFITKDTVKLIDFGAARDFADEKSLSVVLKHGYAPVEQYRRHGRQGPWTDIYALCATIYRCITGFIPYDAMERIYKDELKEPSQLSIFMDSEFESVLMKGLAVKSEDRIQSIDELLSLFESIPSLTNYCKEENQIDNIFFIENSGEQTDNSSDETILISDYHFQKNERSKKRKMILGVISGIVVFICSGMILYFQMNKDNKQSENDKEITDTLDHSSSQMDSSIEELKVVSSSSTSETFTTTTIITTTTTVPITTTIISTTPAVNNDSSKSDTKVINKENDPIKLLLTIPLPEGVRGSYTIEVRRGEETEYTKKIEKAESFKKKEVNIEIESTKDEELTVYIKSEGGGDWIKFAKYKVDFDKKGIELEGLTNDTDLIRITPSGVTESKPENDYSGYIINDEAKRILRNYLFWDNMLFHVDHSVYGKSKNEIMSLWNLSDKELIGNVINAEGDVSLRFLLSNYEYIELQFANDRLFAVSHKVLIQYDREQLLNSYINRYGDKYDYYEEYNIICNIEGTAKNYVWRSYDGFDAYYLTMLPVDGSTCAFEQAIVDYEFLY